MKLPRLTPEQLVEQARRMIDAYGFGSIKLKAGVFEPELEVEGLRALRAAFPKYPLRIDPNGGWSVETTRRLMPALSEPGLLEITVVRLDRLAPGDRVVVDEVYAVVRVAVLKADARDFDGV